MVADGSSGEIYGFPPFEQRTLEGWGTRLSADTCQLLAVCCQLSAVRRQLLFQKNQAAMENPTTITIQRSSGCGRRRA